MKTRSHLIFLSLLLLLLPASLMAINTNVISILSPDKQTKAEFIAGNKSDLQYRILFSGQEVLAWSDAGLATNRGTIGTNTIVSGQSRRSVNEKFVWRLGENDTVINRYNELVLNCKSGELIYKLIVRAYNGSVAFRYDLSTSGLQSICQELTAFRFAHPSVVYQYNQESVFILTAVDTLKKSCDFPATVRSGKFYISVGEAENDSYTKAELVKGSFPNTLSVAFNHDTAVVASGAFRTPWRTVSIAKTAIGLHDFSDLYLRLNSTPVKQIPDWIVPGKLIRSQLNSQSGIDCIDFAVKHHFQYIMFDAGWYGHEFRSTSDPTQVIPEMDLPKIIEYGKAKGIGVILYVNKVGLYARLDTILPLYKKWGVAGFKFGFVDGLTQKGITWLNQAINKVNEYGFILDIHDNYKPTGLSRKYPALLTQEGIRGDENCPDAFHTTVLPYTRFLAGAADFTFCFPNSKEKFSKNIRVSKAQQLALTVVYFSPLQSIFWYGKPLDYTNDEEIEFYDYVPTVWNESHYLAGDIGENISVARRNGNVWYMGNVVGLDDWKTTIRLDFLSAGQRYEATIYEDDGAGNIRKRTENVKKGDIFPVDIKAKGGQAIIIRPKNK
jgi:Glycoside hydrolase 97.